MDMHELFLRIRSSVFGCCAGFVGDPVLSANSMNSLSVVEKLKSRKLVERHGCLQCF